MIYTRTRTRLQLLRRRAVARAPAGGQLVYHHGGGEEHGAQAGEGEVAQGGERRLQRERQHQQRADADDRHCPACQLRARFCQLSAGRLLTARGDF
jgi:hypothetical protein